MPFTKLFCLIGPPMLLARLLAAAPSNLTFEGVKGPGHGKRVVLIAGDDEYHSEQMIPQFGKILAKWQGFDYCNFAATRRLFPLSDRSTIDPHARGTHFCSRGFATRRSADHIHRRFLRSAQPHR